MGTTTIRIDEELRTRVAKAAERVGKTPHAFIVDAIAQTVEQADLDAVFHRLADTRWANVLATGETVTWDDARAYLESRGRGERAKRPTTRKTGG
ncbi:MAG: CopG family transcriptional regulator [Xanthomonadaceae bacterium]|nr:CopG family transcriptional regulator [Xanthomonadaceae bacterium]MDP2186779.1 CopG family transcriptional regulator [Xanthomonadales bacterium]MDZ4114388.1 CopG family transcriptional regulator [Xanthomonadaceae bacterium]MDZ4378752.1 CopG family transcriptional regulator [Xanthomonadaceae bacterium]